MQEKPDDLVRGAAGSLAQVNLWHELLDESGIESRTVGQDLAGGLGSALPGTVELWVRRSDLGATEALIARTDGPHGHDPAPPHRPLPS